MIIILRFIGFVGGDEDAWTDNEVAVNFLAKDDESRIDYCEWAIGSCLSVEKFPLFTKYTYV